MALIWGEPDDAEIGALLNLQAQGDDRFTGEGSEEPWGRTYGGQLIGQAVAAAGASTPHARRLHSLHAYFIEGGRAAAPVVYEVERLREGRALSLRRVVAMQQGRRILELCASYHAVEPGWAHSAAAPQVAPPETLDADRDRVFAALGDLPRSMGEPAAFLRGLDYRLAETHPPGAVPPGRAIWFRAPGHASGDHRRQEAMLAFASDFTLAGATLLDHRRAGDWKGMTGGSLDHALWLHGEVCCDDWLLYVQDGPWAGNARGFARGQIFDRTGRLVASVAQEALIRPLR